MKDLPSEWADVSNTIISADHVFLLFDFDGTLTPIVNRPDLARLPKRTKSLLETLAQTQHYSIGIISGRALDDIKARIAISGITYAANHGLEIDGPGLKLDGTGDLVEGELFPGHQKPHQDCQGNERGQAGRHDPKRPEFAWRHRQSTTPYEVKTVGRRRRNSPGRPLLG